jgi:hypothetical protein
MMRPSIHTNIQDTVRNRPDVYTEAVLGKAPKEYSEWILDPKQWGGELELFILSQYYGAEIVAIEIKSQHCYVYGRGVRGCGWVEVGWRDGYLLNQIFIMPCDRRGQKLPAEDLRALRRVSAEHPAMKPSTHPFVCVAHRSTHTPQNNSVHYDAIAAAAGTETAWESMDQRQFPAGDEESKRQALALASQLKQVREACIFVVSLG